MNPNNFSGHIYPNVLVANTSDDNRDSDSDSSLPFIQRSTFNTFDRPETSKKIPEKAMVLRTRDSNRNSNSSPVFIKPSILKTVGILESSQQIPEQTQVPHANAKRPRLMWFIAGVDIISAIVFTGLLLYNVKRTHSSSGTFIMIWQLFFSTLAIVGRFCMGLVLLLGLSIKENGETVFFCQLWVILQILFLIFTIIKLIGNFVLYVYYFPTDTTTAPEDIPVSFILFAYQLASLIIVKMYSNKLLCKYVESTVEGGTSNIACSIEETGGLEEDGVNQNKSEMEFSPHISVQLKSNMDITAV